MKGYYFASAEEACEWHSFDDHPSEYEWVAQDDKFTEWAAWRAEWESLGEPELVLA